MAVATESKGARRFAGSFPELTHSTTPNKTIPTSTANRTVDQNSRNALGSSASCSGTPAAPSSPKGFFPAKRLTILPYSDDEIRRWRTSSMESGEFWGDALRNPGGPRRGTVERGCCAAIETSKGQFACVSYGPGVDRSCAPYLCYTEVELFSDAGGDNTTEFCESVLWTDDAFDLQQSPAQWSLQWFVNETARAQGCSDTGVPQDETLQSFHFYKIHTYSAGMYVYACM